jgi:hypothetical protein
MESTVSSSVVYIDKHLVRNSLKNLLKLFFFVIFLKVLEKKYLLFIKLGILFQSSIVSQ